MLDFIDKIPGSKTVIVNQWRIHYYDWGPSDAEVVLVCFHGWAGNGLDFYALAQAMPRHGAAVRLIAVDMPGAGYSQRPPLSLGMDGYVDFAADWLGYVKSELITVKGAKIIPVAHSMGGHILLRTLLKYRFTATAIASAEAEPTERRATMAEFDRVILFAPDGLRGEEGLLMGFRSRSIIRKFGPMVSPKTMRGTLATAYYDISSLPDLVAEATVQSYYFEDGFHSLADITKDTLGAQPINGQLAAIDLPVLLLWGRQDNVLKFRYSRTFARELPQVEFCALDQCGHVLQTDLPDQTADLVLGFVVKP